MITDTAWTTRWGGPCAPLSSGYAQIVTREKEVSAGPFEASWNPFSHLYSWQTDDVIQPVAEEIRRLIP